MFKIIFSSTTIPILNETIPITYHRQNNKIYYYIYLEKKLRASNKTLQNHRSYHAWKLCFYNIYNL